MVSVRMRYQSVEEDLSDSELLELSQKRSAPESFLVKGKKVKKVTDGNESEGSFMDAQSDLPHSHTNQKFLYKPVNIKQFLQQTKGFRVRTEDFFPDLNLFIESAKPLTKGSGQHDRDIRTSFRLKKF